jgi:hypothetical protein
MCDAGKPIIIIANKLGRTQSAIGHVAYEKKVKSEHAEANA